MQTLYSTILSNSLRLARRAGPATRARARSRARSLRQSARDASRALRARALRARALRALCGVLKTTISMPNDMAKHAQKMAMLRARATEPGLRYDQQRAPTCGARACTSCQISSESRSEPRCCTAPTRIAPEGKRPLARARARARTRAFWMLLHHDHRSFRLPIIFVNDAGRGLHESLIEGGRTVRCARARARARRERRARRARTT